MRAIAIAAYNRPAYFMRAIKAIAENPLFVEADTWAYFDGRNSTTPEQQAHLSEHYPQIRQVVRQSRIGCGRHLIGIREELYARGYEGIFLVEDDAIVSSNYFQLCLDMYSWVNSQGLPCGISQGYSLNKVPPTEQYELRNALVKMGTGFIAYYLPRKVWQVIRERLLEYESRHLSKCGYKQRNDAAIRKWFQTQVSGQDFEGFPTGQDAATEVALRAEGYLHVMTYLPRCVHIGRIGEHMTEAIWQRNGYDKISLGEIDYLPEKFHWLKE